MCAVVRGSSGYNNGYKNGYNNGYNGHTGGYGYNGYSRSAPSSRWASSNNSSNTDDSRRFIQKLSQSKGGTAAPRTELEMKASFDVRLKGDQLTRQILECKDQWQQCWGAAADLRPEEGIVVSQARVVVSGAGAIEPVERA
ncbi:unnamed protein product [Symbiodinium natans]|uniref:Uncharacterized protein n=1 Tax=Symbiodinium natans TaxID=878477 RepID=A0A812MK76_9DINO|nr:unnamed protein product [Symbiodinium natans]CAE7259935.1 unnamed protein product [Symbiodinium natans]